MHMKAYPSVQFEPAHRVHTAGRIRSMLVTWTGLCHTSVDLDGMLLLSYDTAMPATCLWCTVQEADLL